MLRRQSTEHCESTRQWAFSARAGEGNGIEAELYLMVRRSGRSGGGSQGPSRENSMDRLGSGLNHLLNPTEPQCGEVHIIGAQLIFWKE